MARRAKPQNTRAERLTGARKEVVVDRAEQHMVALLPPSEVMSEIMKEYSLTMDQARKVVTAVRARWKLESAQPEDRKAYKVEQTVRIMGLYRQAREAKQLGVCAKLESLLAKMHGTLEAKKHDHRGIPAPAVPAGKADEFDDRSIEDLDYYAERGFWPEDNGPEQGVEAAAAEGPDFPLH